MKAIKLAKWFLDANPSLRSGYHDDNAKLNMLLYFSILMFYSVKGATLIKKAFEKWDNRPVIREVYETYRYAGLDSDDNLDVDINDQVISQILCIVNLVYGDMSARELSAKTHKSSIWQVAEKNEDLDFSNIDEKEKKLIINLYEAYEHLDFANLGIEKINGNKYYYDKSNIQMTEDLILDLEKFAHQYEPLFLELVDGELVFS